MNDSAEPVSQSTILKASKLKGDDARTVLNCLESQRVVSKLSGENTRYQLDRTKEFLVFQFTKKVGVSAEGHRSVRVKGLLLPIKDGLKTRVVGSTIWKPEVEAPKVRLGPASRKSLSPGSKRGRVSFEKLRSPHNDVKFQLSFDPPLSAGELVEYGFYIWNSHHYAKTRAEALEKFKDEWIREGLVVRDPTMSLSIEVKLPMKYGHQGVKGAKNVVFSGDGTPVSQGETLPPSFLHKSEDRLKLSIENPEPGNYFLCWIPPETAGPEQGK